MRKVTAEPPIRAVSGDGAAPPKVAVLWEKFAPYHHPRISALRGYAEAQGLTILPLELANRSTTYKWADVEWPASGIRTLFPGRAAERVMPWQAYPKIYQCLSELQPSVLFIQGYWPSSMTSAIAAARVLGIPTVLMNDTHEGSAKARYLGKVVKAGLLRGFDAALVAGSPHRDYVAGHIPADRIFHGHCCVDNDFFASAAEKIRADPDRNRARMGLPRRYFLSLGRMVAKKNLPVLVMAYRRLLQERPDVNHHLVMVGDGEEYARLERMCRRLELPMVDHRIGSGVVPSVPAVHFYGFRQLEENAAFYALADAFILPSRCEEWGLVVNEAMACGLPVVVSDAAGCARDLLEPLEAGHSAEIYPGARKNGFVFAPESPLQLAESLETLSVDDDLRTSMGLESRGIVERFSCQVFAENACQAALAAMQVPPGRRWSSRSVLRANTHA